MSYSKRTSLLLLLFLIIPFSYATTCLNSTTSQLLLENARPYTDLNTSFTLRAYYLTTAGAPIQGNETNVTITFSGNTYGMTNRTDYWEITLLSALEEDVDFTVQAVNSYYACKSAGFTGRWRTPFYIQIQVFKESLNQTTPDRYYNDFQYIVLVNNNLKNSYSMASWAFNRGVANSINFATGWLPGAKPLKMPDTMDNNVYFWAKYTNGAATIKIYEPGNYSAYAMNNKVEYPANYFWEFERPTTQDIEYMGNIYDHLEIYNHTNVSATALTYNNSVIKVSLSKLEANTYYALMNIFKIAIVIIIFVLGLVGAIWLAAKTNNGGVIGWYFLLGGSIALGFIFYIR